MNTEDHPLKLEKKNRNQEKLITFEIIGKRYKSGKVNMVCRVTSMKLSTIFDSMSYLMLSYHQKRLSLKDQNKKCNKKKTQEK